YRERQKIESRNTKYKSAMFTNFSINQGAPSGANGVHCRAQAKSTPPLGLNRLIYLANSRLKGSSALEKSMKAYVKRLNLNTERRNLTREISMLDTKNSSSMLVILE
ncbi:hypothetical protein CYMTET_22783, partial [Cymbomonas tetramitiformis]